MAETCKNCNHSHASHDIINGCTAPSNSDPNVPCGCPNKCIIICPICYTQ